MNTDKETASDKLDRLFKKYQKDFSGLYHTFLWELIMNENRKGKESALICLHNKRGFNVGIADKGENGYTPTMICFTEGTTQDDAQIIINDLNEEIFSLSREQAALIVITTMRKK